MANFLEMYWTLWRSGIWPFLANSAKSSSAKILAEAGFKHWCSGHTHRLFTAKLMKLVLTCHHLSDLTV